MTIDPRAWYVCWTSNGTHRAMIEGRDIRSGQLQVEALDPITLRSTSPDTDDLIARIGLAVSAKKMRHVKARKGSPIGT